MREKDKKTKAQIKSLQLQDQKRKERRDKLERQKDQIKNLQGEKKKILTALQELLDNHHKVMNENTTLKKNLFCQIDGNALMIFKHDFINLAESNAAFIDLTEEEINNIKIMFKEDLK